MSRFLAALLCLAVQCAVMPAAQTDELSSARQPAAIRSPGIHAKWSEIQGRIAQDAAQLSACRVDSESCSIEDKKLQTFIDAARAREGRARIGEINRAVNLAIRPESDLRRFGVADRWSSPLETVQAGMGDCEDYAILKFLLLREAGFAADDLRMVVVRDLAASQDHAVVAVRLNERWLVLDNRRFALVEMQHTRYRVLAELSPESDDERDFARALGEVAYGFM